MLFILFGSFLFADKPEDTDRASILILYSSHPGNDWEDAIHLALMNELKKALPAYPLYIEYLDTECSDPELREEVKLGILKKYEKLPLSLILAVGDGALSFLGGGASGFRPDLPVVFCGVEDYESLEDHLVHSHTGVMNRINLADTLDLAYRFVSGLKKVFVVVDNTASGQALESGIRSRIGALRGTMASLEFSFCDSDSLSTNELLSKAATLESDTIMLFALWSRDGRGQYVWEQEFLDRLKGRSSVPVFSLLHKRTGILGGCVASGDIQAFHVVRQIVSVLDGTSPDSIPIVKDYITTYVVDADRMAYWKFDLKDLPPDTEIIGSVPGNSGYLILILGIVTCLIFITALIVAFLLFRSKRRNFRKALHCDYVITSLLDSMEEAFVLTDSDGRILRLNPAAARISGWTEKDAVGMAIRDVFPVEYNSPGNSPGTELAHPLDSQGDSKGTELTHPVDQALAGRVGIFPYGSLVLVIRNGTRIHIAGSTILLKSPVDSSLDGVVFHFRDVSHVEEIQETLFNEQRRLHDAQAMAMIGNWEYNPESNEYWYSPEVYTLTKTDPAQQPPPAVLDFMKQFFPDWHKYDPLPELLSEGEHRLKSLLTIPGRDDRNTILHLMAHMARNPENGKNIVTGILQDFSELTEAKAALKSSQKQLRQFARMEAVGKLAGGIAHEFNNLLQIILGYGQLLTDEVKDDQLKSYIDPILKTAASAKNLTRQLLLFSRKENLDMKPMALSSLVRGMLPLLSRLIGEDIRLEDDLESGDDWIIADRHQIEQVIINLCLNARDAMPGGGVLELYQDVESFVLPQPGVDGLIPSGSYVHLCVRDNGIGIEEDVLPQIFDPFFTTKKHDKGTGLGLSLVYGIVRQHKGFLNVRTDRINGTSFHLYFPREILSPDEKEELIIKEEGSPRISGGMVYMAEDDPMVRQLTETMLRKGGFQIQSFVNGKELIEFLESGKDSEMDLFLLDVIMPEMGGVEAFHKLRSMGYDRPVLFMSGYTQEKLGNLGDLENASHIHKPFTIKDLVGRINEMLNSAP